MFSSSHVFSSTSYMWKRESVPSPALNMGNPCWQVDWSTCVLALSKDLISSLLFLTPAATHWEKGTKTKIPKSWITAFVTNTILRDPKHSLSPQRSSDLGAASMLNLMPILYPHRKVATCALVATRAVIADCWVELALALVAAIRTALGKFPSLSFNEKQISA